MVKTKFKTVLFAVLATTTIMGLPASAQAQTLQSCYDGGQYVGTYEYKKAIKKLSKCLRSGSLTRESWAMHGLVLRTCQFQAWTSYANIQNGSKLKNALTPLPPNTVPSSRHSWPTPNRIGLW